MHKRVERERLAMRCSGVWAAARARLRRASGKLQWRIGRAAGQQRRRLGQRGVPAGATAAAHRHPLRCTPHCIPHCRPSGAVPAPQDEYQVCLHDILAEHDKLESVGFAAGSVVILAWSLFKGLLPTYQRVYLTWAAVLVTTALLPGAAAHWFPGFYRRHREAVVVSSKLLAAAGFPLFRLAWHAPGLPLDVRQGGFGRGLAWLALHPVSAVQSGTVTLMAMTVRHPLRFKSSLFCSLSMLTSVLQSETVSATRAGARARRAGVPTPAALMPPRCACPPACAGGAAHCCQPSAAFHDAACGDADAAGAGRAAAAEPALGAGRAAAGTVPSHIPAATAAGGAAAAAAEPAGAVAPVAACGAAGAGAAARGATSTPAIADPRVMLWAEL